MFAIKQVNTGKFVNYKNSKLAISASPIMYSAINEAIAAAQMAKSSMDNAADRLTKYMSENETEIQKMNVRIAKLETNIEAASYKPYREVFALIKRYEKELVRTTSDRDSLIESLERETREFQRVSRIIAAGFDVVEI